MRGLGAPGVAMSMIVLLYMVSRFGCESAGLGGAILPVAAFLATEPYLFRAPRPLDESVSR